MRYNIRAMSSLLHIPFSYLLWHYTVAWSDLVRLYRNFSWFLWNFFSIRILFGTLFSPWRRLHEGARKDIGGLLGSVIINLILRGIGFVARSATILTGLIALILLALFFLVFLVAWPFLPFLVFVSSVNGIVGMFSFF